MKWMYKKAIWRYISHTLLEKIKIETMIEFKQHKELFDMGRESYDYIQPL